MNENNVELDSVTVNKVLRVYASVSDIEAMDKFLAGFEANATLELCTTLDMARAYLEKKLKGKAREMLRKAEEFKDPESYEKLLRLYGEAGKVKDVFRIWDIYKETRKVDNRAFRTLIGSLLNLDDINRAEEIYYKELESAGLEFDVLTATMLASGYREKGMVDKADKLMYKTMRIRELDIPITLMLEDWGKNGNQVKPSDLRDLIKNLTDSNQFSKALEVSTWMFKNKVLTLFPEDYATRLHLIEKKFGLVEAEKFLKTSIPENMKNYSVYATLLTLYTRSEATLKKAESTFVKMRYFGFLSKLSPFNKMISLYSELGRRIQVENLLKEMKENNIEPDSVTINNLLRVYACVSAIESMEKYKSERDDEVKNLKLEVKTMNAIAEAYEKEGLMLKAIEITASKKEVYRLWNEYKKDNKEKMRSNKEGYLSVVRSLLRLDDVKGAEEMYEEWEPEGLEVDYRIPSLLMSRYCEEVDNEVKAEKVVESCRRKRRMMEFREIFNCVAASSIVLALPPALTWIFLGEGIWGWLGSLLLFGWLVG
ncbi:hypothetical protein AALP_AA3G121900 [Arabis alpina]|nr:hypothetical protein AALP_AA3G121900 [Arabis alpina]